MPLYEYRCLPAGHRFEARHGMTEAPVQVCPECGGAVRRVIHPVGIVFKGSGFYATDSREGQKTAGKPGKVTKEGTPAESSGGSAEATKEKASKATGDSGGKSETPAAG